MKRIASIIMAGLLLALAHPVPGQGSDGTGWRPAAAADRWTGHLSYVFGYKQLGGQWAPADGQIEFGLLDFDCRKERWPVSIAGQFLMSYTGNVPKGLAGNNSGTYELNLGMRKVWDDDRSVVHPFIGGGVSLIGATNNTFINFGDGDTAKVNEHSAAGVGLWGGAGMYWQLSDHWHTGAQVQYSWGELRLGGKDLDGGGLHILGMLGYTWR